jgi:hypothetical protein
MRGLLLLIIAGLFTISACGGGEASNAQPVLAAATDTIIRQVSTRDTIIKHVTASRDTIIKHAVADCCNTTPRPPDCPPLQLQMDTIIRQ